ncbi:preprotein translocase subunit SecA [Collinsella tanakaei]|uniref:preprotein translocase subunit SecA n=1 Tax=Collinsella sp. An271 TaxID=1965616 RepID=UPI000B3A0602|nr:preprotein translocase subunit SecA [Collinsella sp. An271]MBM6786655.1 preprotein translocase subunit SecA [Collinsella tanakaei]OUO61471.1 preprotein translocase subunit SecA [Collinsella sp. An271]
MGFVSKLLSFGADKDLKRYEKMVVKINDLEPTYEKMSDEELAHQTVLFRERYEGGESLDSMLPEAFAVVREASKRTLGLRHFDVQLIGGMALHEGQIAEMKTGEGKTLVSTLAGYLNAIPAKGVHIVTVNDYLARRDSEQMGRIYHFLGMTVGLLQNGMQLDLKRPAYQADVTYGTNSEFGFDYLRDNMVVRPQQRVQRGHAYAIVDEVDSILIDEARTPLIISGAGTKSADTYKKFARAVRGLTRGEEPEFDVMAVGAERPEPTGDFIMDEAKHTIACTEQGLEKVEQRLGIDDIYADLSGQLVNHLQQALKAQYMFHRDKQYVVTNGEVKIVDEFTGRIMEGRRYSEGLHQAIEAKEGVLVREENQTLATITLQNYFRLYDKLSGMTGTALTEDAEFREIYNLAVQVIPPNKPVIRKDNDDLVYRTIDAKFNAVADDVAARHAKGQPVLVGTVSIESSERLSRLLNKRGIRHEVLNAKYHEREAHIVAQAGRLGAVTIATNMAGRGTDILLGGNAEELAREETLALGIDPAESPDEYKRTYMEKYAEAREICASEREKVLAAGGLTVIGTERHESRRIDNQLRGRSGRQGDPGETQFYLSLEDDLMRLFGGDRMDKVGAMMQRYDMPDDQPIQNKIISKAVEGAQHKVENINFSMRKNVLEYDDVMNKQRQVIYAERNKILDGKDLAGHIDEVIDDTVSRCVQEFCAVDSRSGERDLEGLHKWLVELTGNQDAPEFGDEDYEDLKRDVLSYVDTCYEQKSERLGENLMRDLNTQVMLRVIDTRWMNYLQEMDYLKQGIGLRGFGQRDPLVEYKSEAFAAFHTLVDTMYEDYLRTVLRIEVRQAPKPEPPSALDHATYSGPSDPDGASTLRRQAAANAANAAGRAPQGTAGAAGSTVRTYRKDESGDPYANVGRNDPCPCGSGKKFKNCHGKDRV